MNLLIISILMVLSSVGALLDASNSTTQIIKYSVGIKGNPLPQTPADAI